MKDPYTYENGVLVNKLGLTSYEELNQAEADIGFVKLINVDSVDINYFDENLIKKIHKHIFEDIFDWAGEYRSVPLIKEEIVLPGCSIEYSPCNKIDKELKSKISELNSFSWQNMSPSEISIIFAREIALLWRVHPFRDGNTRTMLSFAYLYAKEHGFPFDIETFTKELNRKYDEDGNICKYNIRDKFVLACLDEDDYPEVEYLASVFEKAINEHNKTTNQSQNNNHK